MLGPVQVLVIRVADATGASAVLASLEVLSDDGPVRRLDAFEVTVADDGDLDVADAATAPTLSLFADEAETPDVVPADDVWDLAQVIGPGSRAVIALLEHRWAVDVREALVRSGAVLQFETWLDDETRARLEALLAQAR
jgi:hypothetical protein